MAINPLYLRIGLEIMKAAIEAVWHAEQQREYEGKGKIKRNLAMSMIEHSAESKGISLDDTAGLVEDLVAVFKKHKIFR